MMDLDKTAQELVSKWEHGDEIHRQWLRDKATPDILAALQSVRDETREATLREAISKVDNLIPSKNYGVGVDGRWTAYVKSRRDTVRDLRGLLTEPASEAPDPDGLPIPQFLRRKEAPDPTVALAKLFEFIFNAQIKHAIEKAEAIGFFHYTKTGFSTRLILTDLGKAALRIAEGER